MKSKIKAGIIFWIVNLAVVVLINYGFWKTKETEFNNICGKVITTEKWDNFQKKVLESNEKYITQVWYSDFDKRVYYQMDNQIPNYLRKLLREKEFVQIFVSEIKAYQLGK